jgi:hypothetical protein
MPGLPPNLYTLCRDTLCRCREFQSYQALRAVFVIEQLFPFRIGLPKADNPEEQVDLCLDHLIGRHTSDGQPVLPIFIATLRDRYEPGDALHDDLDDLSRAVQSAMVAQPPTRPAQQPQRSQDLFNHLLKIDFDEQVKLTRQTIQTHRVGAFLVHGGRDCGQQVLVNRLLRLSPGWHTGQRVVIDLGSPSVGKRIRSLWRQVARGLDASPQATPAQLVKKVCEWWQTQDVIFIFHTVDYVPPELLQAWLEEFWQPLVAVAKDTLHRTERETYLLMFLVDYSGRVSNSDIVLAQQIDQSEYPYIPLCLPPADRFPPDVLDSWINFAAEVIPAALTAQEVLESSENGIPWSVYEAICAHCDISWEGELTEWLI